MTLQEEIEYQLLDLMIRETENDIFYFRNFTNRTGLDRDIVCGFMRSMRKRGLVRHGHAFDNGCELAGSGYSVTAAGENIIKN